MTREAEGLTLHLARVLDAPQALVFKACTDAAELARWWGPKGFTTPSVEIDPRVGGSYRIVMQPPQGDAFQLSGEFREVVPPSRLAYTFRWDPPDVDDVETLAVLVLNDLGPKTELDVTQGVFATPPRLKLHEDGWTEALDRLEELLARLRTGRE
jgi:uncharacterized protein YndB with AHSA1/START domain